MAKTKGELYLIPNTLGGESVSDILAANVSTIVSPLRYFAVEDLKSARRLLRKVDRTFPIDESTFFILNKRASENELMAMILEILNGQSMGIISEAGCPGIADPGASLVALAHNHGIHVKPLVGPISFALALMSSGFSGQRFSFHGYLPKDRKDRVKKLRDLEMENRRHGDTHLFMDTPFRSMHVLEDLLNELSDQTELCLAVNLTLPNQRIQTMTIKEWRLNAFDINKAPAVFIIGTSQH